MANLLTSVSNYKAFLIQADGDATAIDTSSAYWMLAKSNPLPLMPSPKEPYGNDWKDEDGTEEYTASMHYESIEFSVGFIIKCSTEAELRTKVNAFFDKVKSGTFKTYDSYTEIGFKNVRYAGFTENEFRARNGFARAIFTVNFKTNSPTTRMKLQNNVITEA